MLEKYVKDVQNWPHPTSCREMSSFLGFAGYYRGFIPGYSALTNRMNSMKKAEKFKWSDDMETLCISEGRTIGFSEEQGEMEAYLEVPSQLFSLYIVSFKSEESIF